MSRGLGDVYKRQEVHLATHGGVSIRLGNDPIGHCEKQSIMKRLLTTTLKLVLVSIVLVVVLINTLPDLWFKAHLSKNWNAPEINVSVADSSTDENKLCLVLALDGVPYDLMSELHDEGFFKGFHEPGRLVSTFPSLTRPAFSRMLIGGKPFGYERLYFDRQENRIKGFHLAQKILSTSKEHLDYHPKLHFLGFPGYIAYVFPDRFTQTAMDAFKQRLLTFQGNEFIAYMGLTDAIAHVDGRTALKGFLKQISDLIHEIRSELGASLDIVVFSDHGNNMVQNNHVDLAATLVENGYQDRSALEAPKDFVLVRNGFVSSAVLYTDPDNARGIATLLSKLEGVDFSVYMDRKSVMIAGSTGIARIERKGERYMYTELDGDPLKLGGIVQRLRLQGKTDKQGFVHGNDWWHATKGHVYPDPLHRIWQGLHDLVEHPATLMVSFKDGYAFGPVIFEQNIVSGREGTHGALLANHSNGFFMTDFMQVKPYNRPRVVADLLARAAAAKQQANNNSPLD